MVDGCDRLSWEDKERSVHLRVDHHFPESYNFHKPMLSSKKAIVSNNSSKSEARPVSDAELPEGTPMEVDGMHKHQGRRQSKKEEKKKKKEKSRKKAATN